MKDAGEADAALSLAALAHDALKLAGARLPDQLGVARLGEAVSLQRAGELDVHGRVHADMTQSRLAIFP